MLTKLRLGVVSAAGCIQELVLLGDSETEQAWKDYTMEDMDPATDDACIYELELPDWVITALSHNLPTQTEIPATSVWVARFD